MYSYSKSRKTVTKWRFSDLRKKKSTRFAFGSRYEFDATRFSYFNFTFNLTLANFSCFRLENKGKFKKIEKIPKTRLTPTLSEFEILNNLIFMILN